MKHIYLAGVVALAGCTLVACDTANLTPVQVTEAANRATRIEADAVKVSAACVTAVQYADLAAALPIAGPYIAAGVKLGCSSTSGLAKLIANPTSAEWLSQQIQLLKVALQRAGMLPA